MTSKEKAQKWLESPRIDQDTRNEVHTLLEDEQALEEAFYKDLEFGTGGLRGIMGAGTNRMNRYTVAMATQGLANYLKKNFRDLPISVAIAHDSRNQSDVFARTTAEIFAANGITVYLFPDLRPTPMLSYAIRKLECKSGVVITASHNPKEYNGYKAYWDDGGQIIAPHDKGIIEEVRKIISFDEVMWEGNGDLIKMLDEKMDQDYLNDVLSLRLTDDLDRSMKIVYSPIHGTGVTAVPQALEKYGYSSVYMVEEQAKADGNFPTVVYPNPEEKEAMQMALEKAKEMDADLIMATDPDADRVGIGVKNHHGEFQLLNGNQTAALLIYYLCSEYHRKNQTENSFIGKTVVTTELLTEIASHFGIPVYNTLTGFKFIAELIRNKEGHEKFIGGGEESYGYLIGDFVRDKDAVASCVMIAEAVAWARAQNMSAFDLLLKIYNEFGFYQEKLVSMTKKGKAGAEEIQEMMSTIRKKTPATLGGSAVITVLDYQEGMETNLKEGKQATLDFPKSNVLQFLTADGSKVSLRPSGTEPKIKFYFSARISLTEIENYDAKLREITEKLDQMEKDLLSSF
jgi:phosphoglucomutase